MDENQTPTAPLLGARRADDARARIAAAQARLAAHYGNTYKGEGFDPTNYHDLDL